VALIVEDGTRVPGAEAFSSVATFKMQSDNFGYDYSAFTDTQIEVALRKGCLYLKQDYRMRWKGVRYSATQPQDWPRSAVSTETGYYGNSYSYRYLVPPNVVPVEVVSANIILAQKVLSGTELFPDGTQKTAQETIGPITVKYEQGSSQRIQFDAVEALLAPFLSSLGGVNVQLVRG